MQWNFGASHDLEVKASLARPPPPLFLSLFLSLHSHVLARGHVFFRRESAGEGVRAHTPLDLESSSSVGVKVCCCHRRLATTGKEKKWGGKGQRRGPRANSKKFFQFSLSLSYFFGFCVCEFFLVEQLNDPLCCFLVSRLLLRRHPSKKKE